MRMTSMNTKSVIAKESKVDEVQRIWNELCQNNMTPKMFKESEITVVQTFGRQ